MNEIGMDWTRNWRADQNIVLFGGEWRGLERWMVQYAGTVAVQMNWWELSFEKHETKSGGKVLFSELGGGPCLSETV